MAGKGMLSVIIILLIGSVLVGYLIYKIWIDRKRKIGIGVTVNRNASTRRKRSKKKKKSSSNKSKRKKSSRAKTRKTSKRKTTDATKSKSKKRKRTHINSELPDEHNYSPVEPMQPLAEAIKPINMEIDHSEKPSKEVSFHQLNEKHPNNGFVAIARGRSRSTKMSDKKCMNCKDSYSTVFRTANNVDFIKNVLPCDENDTANFSKYEYELNYDEEHFFRC